MSWRVRVNVLFSDLYSSNGCSWSRVHFTALWGSKTLKKESPEGSNLLPEVNGTVMIFCSAKVEICLKSQKPVILESTFMIHLLLLAKGSMD